jgi:hypothetical protein
MRGMRAPLGGAHDVSSMGRCGSGTLVSSRLSVVKKVWRRLATLSTRITSFMFGYTVLAMSEVDRHLVSYSCTSAMSVLSVSDS